MLLKPIELNIEDYPDGLRVFLSGAKLYDSSCSPEASVIFVDKDGGYFLKTAKKGTLELENAMTRYFHNKGLTANVLAYISDERDFLLTERIRGDDGVAKKYLSQPERFCDIFAQKLAELHSMDFTDCPVPNHTEWYLAQAEHNKNGGVFDENLFPDNWGYASAKEAWAVVESRRYLLKTDTLLHGDYCLPNIILDNWKFSGFIDLGASGVGDRHIDLFWGIWSLSFNLKTDKYRERFIDAYGRDKVDEDMLHVVAAVEVFG